MLGGSLKTHNRYRHGRIDFAGFEKQHGLGQCAVQNRYQNRRCLFPAATFLSDSISGLEIKKRGFYGETLAFS